MASIMWPLERNVIRKRRLSNTFGIVRRYPNGKPRAHQGWDLEARVGTETYAVSDGKVIFVQNVGAFGLQVCISFESEGNTYYAFYAHLQHLSVAQGQKVIGGQPIGTTGKSGNAWKQSADEDHLHFEIRTTPYCGLGLGGRMNPLHFYGLCPLHVPICVPRALLETSPRPLPA